MLAVGMGLVYRLVVIEQQRNGEYTRATAYDSLALSLRVSLADLRGAQYAYVAAGQDLSPWIERAAREFTDISVGFAQLEDWALSSATVDALNDARTTLERLRRVDAIARTHAAEGQALMASDLVFSDGRDLAQRTASHLELAQAVEREARSRTQHELRRVQVASIGVAALVIVLGSALLMPRGESPVGARRRPDDTIDMRPEAESALGSAANTKRTPSTDTPNGRVIEIDVPVSTPAVETVETSAASVPTPKHRTSRSPEPIVRNLRLTAEVCTDLGRLSKFEDLAAILARAGQLLNAIGLVLWVRDDSGIALRAATCHGYDGHQLARLGRVPCDSDNATAAAYRTAQLQTVLRDKNRPGAVAVPLLASSTGNSTVASPCVGVLSIEVEQGLEESEAVQATASILAAQLATLISADPAREAADSQTQAVG